MASKQRLHIALTFGAVIALARPAHTQSRTPRVAPTQPQLDALRTLEQEVRDFSLRADGFRLAMRQALQGRHARELAAIRQRFERQIANERSLEAQARRRAIEAFERFVLAYPSDETHTPDVLLRLSELYFDDARLVRLQQDEALDAERAAREQRGQSTDDLAEPPPTDYRCSILTYRHVLRRFARYPRRDAALYLVGWTLGELGRDDEAASAQRALVCAGRASYAPALDLREPLAPNAPRALRCDSFARSLEAQGAALAPTVVAAPAISPAQYPLCVAAPGANGAPSRYAAEVWYALGDRHFDASGDPNTNSLAAIAAYTRARQLSEASEPSRRGPFWARAQYKIGWAHFRRDGGYADAIREFSLLLDHTDVARDPVASGLRSDAIRWVGVTLSESLWNPSTRNGDPEQQQCQPLVERLAMPPRDAVRPFDCAGLVRMQSAITAEHPWRAEAWLELANDYFLQTKYSEALSAYRLFLQTYSAHPEAPRASVRVGECLRRLGLRAQANQSDASLSQYAEGSSWAGANEPHTVARAERIVRDALRSAAIDEHQRARSLRARAASITDERERSRAIEEARAAYVTAASMYQSFVERFVHEAEVEELAFNRADALFWAERFEDAARAYEQIRDRNDGNAFVASAAYMATVARARLVSDAVSSRSIAACDARRAGVSAGSSAECPLSTASQRAMPAVIRALVLAREGYLRTVEPSSDHRSALSAVQFDGGGVGSVPPFRAVFLYRNAIAQLWFGRAEEGEAALRSLVEGGCDVSAEVRNLAAVELAESLSRRAQPVSPSALLERAMASRGCRSQSTSALSQAQQAAAMRLARGAFDEAMRSRDDRAASRYREAARLYEIGARSLGDDPDAFVARYMHALSLDRAGDASIATDLHERNLRAIDALTPTRRAALTSEASRSLGEVLAQTLFRLAEARVRSLDDDDALRLYERALREPSRSSAQSEGSTLTHAQEALRAIATIQRRRLAWSESSRAWTQFASLSTDVRQRAEALYASAEAESHAGGPEHALRVWRAFREASALAAATVEHHLRAQRAIVAALAAMRMQREADRERASLVELYRAHPEPDLAALVASALLDPIASSVDALSSPLREGSADAIASQLRERASAVASIDERVRAVIDYRAAEPSVAALEASARAHEQLSVQLARVSAIVRLTPAQERSLAAVETQAARIDRLASSVERANPAQAEQLRARAGELRERTQTMRDAALRTLQERFDREAEAERTLAVQGFIASAQIARRAGISSTPAARALDRLRLDENRALIDSAVQSMPRSLRESIAVDARAARALIAVESAGASVVASGEVATPGLSR